jgi:Raf kinase inhibitor-like YbhB/YbcL family protein
MKLWSDAFENGQPIPPRYAMGRSDPDSHATFSDNVSPPLRWSGLPQGTRSLALIVHDADAPSHRDDVNVEGRSVPSDLPRVPFDHWVLVDLPTETAALAEGEFCRGVTPHGKAQDASARGTRHGLNSYTGWFEGEPSMRGDYYGYDGPFPPWNDSIVHHYHFALYALDVERCGVGGRFTSEDVRAAIAGHILGEAHLMGTYSLNPAVR